MSLGLTVGIQKYPRPGTDPRYTKTPFGTLPIGAPVDAHIVRLPRRKLKGYAVGAWGNLCKAGLPSVRQNAAHGQITERSLSIP